MSRRFCFRLNLNVTVEMCLDSVVSREPVDVYFFSNFMKTLKLVVTLTKCEGIDTRKYLTAV